MVIPNTQNIQIWTMSLNSLDYFVMSLLTSVNHWDAKICPLQNLCLVTGSAQFQSCYDSTGCEGNVLTSVSTSEECCLGSGLSFQIGAGICRQCIGKELQCLVRSHCMMNVGVFVKCTVSC